MQTNPFSCVAKFSEAISDLSLSIKPFLGYVCGSEISRARIPALSFDHPCCLIANTLPGVVLSSVPDNAWAQLGDSTGQGLFSGGSERSLFWGVKAV